jgi:putative transcriptional regulator
MLLYSWVIIMESNKFISKLEEARKKTGLSQENLAKTVGTSRETIRNIENGKSIPNVILALALASVVGWAIENLFKPKE